jgi:hypothetical protein
VEERKVQRRRDKQADGRQHEDVVAIAFVAACRVKRKEQKGKDR